MSIAELAYPTAGGGDGGQAIAVRVLKALHVNKPSPKANDRVAVSVYWEHRNLLVAAAEILRVSNPETPLAMPDVAGRVIELGVAELQRAFVHNFDAQDA